MPNPGRTYCIVGAGIAGLALALALAKFGAKVVVLERAPMLSPFGAGLQISPNARKVLDALGLDSALAATAFEPAGIDIFPHRAAQPLMTLALGEEVQRRFGAPYTVMHRADLADVLHKACRRFANIEIVFGMAAWHVAAHDSGVTISIDTGETVPRVLKAAALIGADGVHSRTRTELLGGPPAIPTGRTAWRTLLPLAAAKDFIATDRVSVLFAPTHHLVCYPVPQREAVNLALFTAGSVDRGPAPEAPDRARLKLGDRDAGIVAAAGDSWTAWPLYTVQTEIWHRGHVAVMGDAAHAMVPFQAQGAAMAIEDAAALGSALTSEDDPRQAFLRFATERRGRVARVARTSERNGRIFHLDWPMSTARDAVLRFAGPRGQLRRLDWLYGHNALSGLTRSIREPT